MGIPKAPDLPFIIPEIPSLEEMIKLEKFKKEELLKIKEIKLKLKTGLRNLIVVQ